MNILIGFLGTIGAWAYLGFRIIGGLVLAGLALLLLIGSIIVSNTDFIIRIVVLVMGAGLSFGVYKTGSTTVRIILGKQPLSIGAKISGVPLLISFLFLLLYLGSVGMNFAGPMKAQIEAVRIIEQSLPAFSKYSEWNEDEKKNAVPVLIEFLTHENWRVRRNAVSTLGYGGRISQEAVPALAELMKSDPFNRDWAARALLKIGNLGREKLEEMSSGSDEDLKAAADLALRYPH